MLENSERDGLKQRITEMVDFLKDLDADIEGYDGALVRKMIEEVTVYEERFVVEFKAGISLDISRWKNRLDIFHERTASNPQVIRHSSQQLLTFSR